MTNVMRDETKHWNQMRLILPHWDDKAMADFFDLAQDKTLASVLAMKDINFNLVSLLLTEDQSISVLTVARVACGAWSAASCPVCCGPGWRLAAGPPRSAHHSCCAVRWWNSRAPGSVPCTRLPSPSTVGWKYPGLMIHFRKLLDSRQDSFKVIFNVYSVFFTYSAPPMICLPTKYSKPHCGLPSKPLHKANKINQIQILLILYLPKQVLVKCHIKVYLIWFKQF